jgi:hypothetical protein
MAPEGDVVLAGGESPGQDAGDSQAQIPAQDVVQQANLGQQPQPEVKLVPETDLNALRSAEQRRYAQLEREYQQTQQQLQEYQQWQEQLQWQQTTSSREQELVQQFLAAGMPWEQANQFAAQQAYQEVQYQYQLELAQRELEQYNQQGEQAQRIEYLREIRDDVLQTYGLSEDELLEATGHLDPDAPDFERQVYKLASQFRNDPRRQTAQNQHLRDQFRSPQGSAPGGDAWGTPPQVPRWHPDYKAYLDEVRRRQAQGES